MNEHQKQILTLIQMRTDAGLAAPTYTEMCAFLNQSSKQAPARAVEALIAAGMLERNPAKHRGLSLTIKGARWKPEAAQ